MMIAIQLFSNLVVDHFPYRRISNQPCRIRLSQHPMSDPDLCINAKGLLCPSYRGLIDSRKFISDLYQHELWFRESVFSSKSIGQSKIVENVE